MDLLVGLLNKILMVLLMILLICVDEYVKCMVKGSLNVTKCVYGCKTDTPGNVY